MLKYSDFLQDDVAVDKFIALLEKLDATYNKLAATVQKEATALREATVTTSGASEQQRKQMSDNEVQAQKLAKEYQNLRLAQSETTTQVLRLKEAQAALNAQHKVSVSATSNQAKALLDLKEQQKLLNLQTRASSAEESKYADEIIRLEAAMKRAAEIRRLNITIASTEEGSYDRLSAQYSLNKIKLNAMSLAMRENTDAGKQLVKETLDIYTEMDRLQKATGKYSLSVGNYAQGMAGLNIATQQVVRELPSLSMGINQFILAISNNIPMLNDQIRLMKESNKIAKQNGQSTVSVTGALIKSLFSWQSALIVGITLLSTYGKDIVNWAAKMFSSAKSTNFFTQQLEALNKKQEESMVASAGEQAKLLSMIETMKSASASRSEQIAAAKALQKEYPKQLKSMTEDQILTSDLSKLYKQLAGDVMKLAMAKAAAKQLEENIGTRIQKQIELNKAQKEQTDAQKEYNKIASQNKSLYKGDEIETYSMLLTTASTNLGETSKKVEGLQWQIKLLDKANEDLAKTAFPGFNDTQSAEAMRDMKQILADELALIRRAEDSRIDLIGISYNKEVAETKTKYKRLREDLDIYVRDHKDITKNELASIRSLKKDSYSQERRDLKKLEQDRQTSILEIRRKTQDLELQLLPEGFDKQREVTAQDYDRQIQDLEKLLMDKKTMGSLEVGEEEQLTKQLEILHQLRTSSLGEIDKNAEIDRLNRYRDYIASQLDLVQQGTEAELNLRLKDIETARQIELAENAKAKEKNRKSEAEINRRYDAIAIKARREAKSQILEAALSSDQDYERSLFDLKVHSAYETKKFELTQAKDRLVALYAEKVNARMSLSEVELSLLTPEDLARMDQDIMALKNKIDKANFDIGKNETKKTVWDLMGFKFDDEQAAQSAFSGALSISMQNLSDYADAWTNAAQAAVDATTKIVDATQARLDSEIEASKNGYANKAATAQKELDLAKRNQEKALKEQQKAQKAQAALDTVMQTVNLITATSEIWKQFAKYPPVAIAMTALMWGSFLAAKVKAAQVTKQKAETYGEGTVELLEGGSHASGNDIDLGTRKNGTRRRAEGGEYFAVVRKSMSQKYGSEIPNIIDSLNKGLFEQKYTKAYSGIDDQIIINASAQGIDLGDIGDNVRSISRRSRIYSIPGGYVEEYKNMRRIIKQ